MPSSKMSRRTIFIVASAVIALILVIGGIFYYQSYIAPFRRPVITVDGTVIRMGYFLRRTKLAASDPINMLQQLTIEQIVRIKAPGIIGEPPPSNIDTVLRNIAASGDSTSLTDSEFKDWYRQELKASGLSDAEYRDVVYTNILVAAFQQYLAEQVPTEAEQVHLSIIQLQTSGDADKARARIEAGESFAAVARDVSLDTQSQENGGDIGWIPRGVTIFDSQIFSLPIGQVSEPVPYYSQSGATTPDAYYLLLVSEKATSRPIDEDNLTVLKNQALYNWLVTEIPLHTLEYNYDSETQAWIELQLAKMPTPQPLPALTPAPAPES